MQFCLDKEPKYPENGQLLEAILSTDVAQDQVLWYLLTVSIITFFMCLTII